MDSLQTTRVRLQVSDSRPEEHTSSDLYIFCLSLLFVCLFVCVNVIVHFTELGGEAVEDMPGL